MELFIGVAVVIAVAGYLYVRSNKQDAIDAGVIALGEPPATVVVPVTESTLVVEGAGAVAVPAKKARAKKPAAPKAAKAPVKAKPKAPAKPKAKKPAGIKAPK
jgi:hypothetical protein